MVVVFFTQSSSVDIRDGKKIKPKQRGKKNKDTVTVDCSEVVKFENFFFPCKLDGRKFTRKLNRPSMRHFPPFAQHLDGYVYRRIASSRPTLVDCVCSKRR
ncbi:conserved hypothetical protein [Trichinella spiralis]|uniref:hypothetical protein n=1 Tax=Trichinella spiralis TaxID=6334 RepID=UPI0001EFD94F|nr:conserved hypothetical protein [Trichinella spiralis]